MADYVKTDLLAGIAAALSSNPAHSSWANIISVLDESPTMKTLRLNTRANGCFIGVLDDGADFDTEGTMSEIWDNNVSILHVAPNTAWKRNSALLSISEIEDNTRGLLKNNTSVYSVPGFIWIIQARVITLPPAFTILEELYADPQSSNYKMGAVSIKYKLRQLR